MLDGALCEVSGLCCPSPAIGHSLASPEQLMHLTSSPKRFVRTIGRSEASRFVQATLTQGKERSHELTDFCPFRLLQLVLVGDFFQLPPIGERDSEGRTIPADFIFQTESWKALDPVPVRLTEVFRQKDKELITVLNECRVGKLSPKTVSTLKGLRRPVTYPDGIYTSLCI